jgi:hypothetical protein
MRKIYTKKILFSLAVLANLIVSSAHADAFEKELSPEDEVRFTRVLLEALQVTYFEVAEESLGDGRTAGQVLSSVLLDSLYEGNGTNLTIKIEEDSTASPIHRYKFSAKNEKTLIEALVKMVDRGATLPPKVVAITFVDIAE